MMDFILTNHAKQRIIDREISLNQIKDTVNFPDYTIRKDGKTEVYKKIEDQKIP